MGESITEAGPELPVNGRRCASIVVLALFLTACGGGSGGDSSGSSDIAGGGDTSGSSSDVPEVTDGGGSGSSPGSSDPGPADEGSDDSSDSSDPADDSGNDDSPSDPVAEDGDNDGSTDSPDAGGGDSVPAAATLVLDVVPIRTFRFSWTDVSGATHYKLLENPDGVSGFTQLGGDIAQGIQRIEPAVPVHERVNARYLLQSCNAAGCVDSSAVSAGDTLADIAYIKASNTGGGDIFGAALDLSADGGTLAVGAWYEDSHATGIDGSQASNLALSSGAVYVFSRNGDDWIQQAYIKAGNAQRNDQFGAAVSLSADGNTLVVGAIGEDGGAAGVGGNPADNSAPDAGAVYVFGRDGNGWSQQAYLKAGNTEAGDVFGAALDLSADGDTLAVGALREDSNATGVNGNPADNSAPDAGAVYVFGRAGDGWSQQAYIKAGNTEAGDVFGAAVSLDAGGDTLAVGAWNEDSNATGINGNPADNSAPDAGAVYVFGRDGDTWSQQAYVKADNTGGGDIFGAAVALAADGNTLATGAVGEDSNATGIDGEQADDSAPDAGAVYVFSRVGGSWSRQAYIKAGNSDAGDRFGAAVSLAADGDTLAAAAWFEASNATGMNGDQTDNSAPNAGAVYVFKRGDGSWNQQGYVKAPNTDAADLFGRAVKLDAAGGMLAAGAVAEDSSAAGIDGDQTDNSASNAGAVYLY